MIPLGRVNEDDIDRILANGPSPSFEGDVHTLMAMHLEGILANLIEQQSLARWDVRTELNRAINLFTRGALRLNVSLERVADLLSHESIVKGVQEAVLTSFLHGKDRYTDSEYPAARGFARPAQLIGCMDDNLSALADILTDPSTSLGGQGEQLVDDVFEMKSMVRAWGAQLDHRVGEPFRLAAIDAYAEDRTRFRWPGPSDQSERSIGLLVDRVRISLRSIEQIVAHFQLLISDFDRLDPKSPELNEQIAWSNKCTSPLGREVRKYLIPYMRNRRHGGLAPDMALIRQIADLYRALYGQRFRINGAETNDSYKRATSKIRRKLAASGETGTLRSHELAQYKSGPAMQFACSIVDILGLHSILFPFTENELGFDPMVHGVSERPTEDDVKQYNRSFGPARRSGISQIVLVNKIGDIWKRDHKRRTGNN